MVVVRSPWKSGKSQINLVKYFVTIQHYDLCLSFRPIHGQNDES